MRVPESVLWSLGLLSVPQGCSLGQFSSSQGCSLTPGNVLWSPELFSGAVFWSLDVFIGAVLCSLFSGVLLHPLELCAWLRSQWGARCHQTDTDLCPLLSWDSSWEPSGDVQHFCTAQRQSQQHSQGQVWQGWRLAAGMGALSHWSIHWEQEEHPSPWIPRDAAAPSAGSTARTLRFLLEVHSQLRCEV